MGSGSFGKVEATTAINTLIIGKGVKIDKLVINGGNVKLEGDLELSKALEITANSTVDLNGHEITASGTAFYVTGGEVIINGNGKVSAASNTNNVAVWVADNATVNIKNGTFSVGIDNEGKTNSCIYSTGGEITIEGGTFSNAGGTYGGGGIFNVQKDSNGKITINKVDAITVGESSVEYEEEDKTANLIIDNREENQ